MAQDKSINDFKKKTKVASIIQVDPQGKTVDIQYLSQGGKVLALKLPYSMVSGTWGLLHMPQIGDKVLVDNADGETPTLKAMVPQNTDYLPYLDPGEVSMSCENGSFLHQKNRRKKAISTGALLDYNATTGPNGADDIEYEPGGIIIQARSKQQQENPTPRWYNHSYINVVDNGDVTIQSMVSDKAKGLFHFDGATGHAWWHAGDGKVEQYIELDPVKDEIVILSNGDVHQHAVADWKVTAYKDNVVNIGGVLQWKAGVPVSTISADFDQIIPDSDLNPGDIRIDNSQSTGNGKFYLHVKGNCAIIVDEGDVDLTVSQGNLNVAVNNGGINIAAMNNVNVSTTSGNVTVGTNTGNITLASADGDVNLDGNVVNITATTLIALSAPSVTGA